MSSLELARVVHSDLKYLRDEWGDSVSDDTLRRSSTVLRRLLVDGDLQRAWKTVGLPCEPQITAAHLKTTVLFISQQNILFASAGGATYHGVELRGALATNFAMNEKEIRRIGDQGVPERTVGLRQYIADPCIIILGADVSRRVLIKYIANKLGGAHHDSRRLPTKEEDLYSRLDAASQHILLMDKPAAYFELLSIGQALSASSDLRSFSERVSQSP